MKNLSFLLIILITSCLSETEKKDKEISRVLDSMETIRPFKMQCIDYKLELLKKGLSEEQAERMSKDLLRHYTDSIHFAKMRE